MRSLQGLAFHVLKGLHDGVGILTVLMCVVSMWAAATGVPGPGPPPEVHGAAAR